MPQARYLKITIGGKQIQITDPAQVPITIDYSLEDPDNFQTKTSATALAVKIPASKLNDVAGNTFRNPDIMDLTTGSAFRGNQAMIIEENGFEIMVGKAFLVSATHTDKPIDYTYNFFGDNASWKIDMADFTLYDFLKSINFTFTEAEIISSWDFDGTNVLKPYVFAPVRYRNPVGGTSINDLNVLVADDVNMLPIYMRPSLSKYWIIFNAFKSLGYRIQSAFMDTAYFRRQVMPWTWGNFLSSDGTSLDTHRFLAMSLNNVYYNFTNGNKSFYWDLLVSNKTTTGGFDNNGDYAYLSGTQTMQWTYKTPDYGNLDATLDMQIQTDARLNGTNSEIKLQIEWYKNGTLAQTDTVVNLGGSLALGKEDAKISDIFFTVNVSQGDVITAKIKLSGYASKLGFASITANVLGFQMAYFRIPIGGVINFTNYTGLQSFKFLDFLKGVIDEFNMSIDTDAKNKILYIEPTHPYAEGDDFTIKKPGYFKEDFIDWNGKEDLSQTWQMDNYSDFNQTLTFNYKNDSNDGIMKIIQDRNINIVAAGKYIFPPRFQVGTTAIENSFFSATMHYDVDQWKYITGVSPQMVAMIPENIANTSNIESGNTFAPKSCYYKGRVSGCGGWKFNGVEYTDFPFMFSVNYQAGGENDPILSYSDEKITGTSAPFVIGKGLIKRFYWQRLAIIRNGQWYTGWFRLKNTDVVDQLHREYKSYKGQRWELITLTAYKPLSEQSTQVLMRKWSPVGAVDLANTYPSSGNVLTKASTDPLDMIYAQLKCLTSDIPVL